MKQNKYCLNNNMYTKSDALKKCSEILNTRTPLSLEDRTFLIDVLKFRYPDKPFKNNVLIKKVVNRCFYYSEDGISWRDFSYKKAFKSQACIVRDNTVKAFRYEIYSQVKEYKDNLLLGAKENYHVDHVYPFYSLLQEFLISVHLSLEQIPIEKTNDLSNPFPTWRLKDRSLALLWQDYHRVNARLQILTAKENLAKGFSRDIRDCDFRSKGKK